MLAEDELNELSEKIKLLSTKGCNLLYGRTYFTDNDGYQKILVFALMFNSITLDNNKKVTNWISTGQLPEEMKLFDVNLVPTMTNLANGRISLKLVLVPKSFSFLHSNFISN